MKYSLSFFQKLVLTAVGIGSIGAFVSCRALIDPPPSRETVYPLLQQEALDMKRDGENISPKLEVELIWEIQSVEAIEQPNDEQHPWAGRVRFKIISKIKELDGYITEEMDKTFNYIWDRELEKWLAE